MITQASRKKYLSLLSYLDKLINLVTILIIKRQFSEPILKYDWEHSIKHKNYVISFLRDK